jgi:hypothetical protein
MAQPFHDGIRCALNVSSEKARKTPGSSFQGLGDINIDMLL